MTTEQKIARRKLTLLELAQELGNVSKACRLVGYSRQQFYEIRRNYQTYGAEGLLDRMPGARGPHPNRVSAEIEAAVALVAVFTIVVAPVPASTVAVRVRVSEAAGAMLATLQIPVPEL